MKTTIGLALFGAIVMSAPAAQAAGDAANGEKLFKRCVACHTLEAGKNKVGPSLHGIIGRTAGTAEGYKYSDINTAASEAGLVWTEENIVTYLEDPQAFLEAFVTGTGASLPSNKRTKMAFKLRKLDQREDVVAYLKSLQ